VDWSLWLQVPYNLYLSMVIAVPIVLVMQMAIDQIVDVITVGDCRMPAPRSVNVVGAVSRADMTSGASCWVLDRDLQDMLLDLTVCGGVVQVPIVQVIDVSIVLYGGMSAVFAVDMVVVFVVV